MTAIVSAFQAFGLFGTSAPLARLQASDWSNRVAFGTAPGAARGSLTGTRTC